MTKFCNARVKVLRAAEFLVSDYPPPEGCCEWSSYLVITDTIAQLISVCQAFLPKNFQQVWGRLKHGGCLRLSQPATVAPTHNRPQTADPDITRPTLHAPAMLITPPRYYEGMTSRTEQYLLCEQPAAPFPMPLTHCSEPVLPTAPLGQPSPIVSAAIVFLSTSLRCQFANCA